eukprot:302975_1
MDDKSIKCNDMQLKVGDVVEIQMGQDDRYTACIIEEINIEKQTLKFKEYFETLFSGYGNPIDLHLPKDIKPLYTNTIEIFPCVAPPHFCHTNIPIIYYQRYIIFVCDYLDSFIYFYDIYHNKYIQKYHYPKEFHPQGGHGAVIDNNLLYIFGGIPSVFGILNLDTFELTSKDTTNSWLSLRDIVPQSYLIDNYIYFLNKRQDLLQLDIQNRKYTKLDSIYHPEIWKGQKLHVCGGRILGASDCNMVHINENQLIGFSTILIKTNSETEPESNLFSTWYYDIVSANNKCVSSDVNFPSLTSYPSDTNVRCVINGFDINKIIFLIVIDPKNGDLIACFDVLTNKWYQNKVSTFTYKKNMEFNDFYQKTRIVRDDKYYVHIFSFLPKRIHFKASLFDMIPIELKHVYAKYFCHLVDGYTRIKIENKYDVYIPKRLKEVISEYFPLFL